jgi:uncharacterized protein (DUF4415 family)
MNIQFEWDSAKASINLRKHGVSFDDAIVAFADPYALMTQDRIEGSEKRWQTLGLKSSASFRREPQTVRSENSMKTKIVKRAVDLQNLPSLTEEQRARLSLLKRVPDSEIDYSDTPPLGDAFWKNAIRNPLYKATKQATTVRLDSDVLLWLKSAGKGYQTRINAILREAMMRQHG